MRPSPGTFLRLLAATLVLLLVAAPAPASTRFGIAGFAGYNSYKMSDVNDDLIQEINNGLAGSGYEMDEISGGWGFGGGLRIQPNEKVLFALDYERLTASSDLSLFGGTLEINSPANAFTGTVSYFFPSASRTRFGLGAGIGYYSSNGSVEADSAGVGFQVDVEGNGIGFHGVGALDVGLSPNVHLQGLAGYRFAETSDLEIAGETAYRSDGEEATLDWTGFMSRAGLTFYFGAN